MCEWHYPDGRPLEVSGRKLNAGCPYKAINLPLVIGPLCTHLTRPPSEEPKTRSEKSGTRSFLRLGPSQGAAWRGVYSKYLFSQRVLRTMGYCQSQLGDEFANPHCHKQ